MSDNSRVRLRYPVVCGLALAFGISCADWTENQPQSHAIVGCSDAVKHLHDCCPAYASYISCTVLESASNSNAFPDLDEKQSRCLKNKSCDELAAAVVKKDGSLCGYTLASHSCR